MKILLVGETGSIHLARWTNQLCGTGWDIHLFDAGLHGPVCEDLRCGTVHLPTSKPAPEGVSVMVPPPPFKYWSKHPAELASRLVLRKAIPHLVKVIQEVEPDIIHSHGLNLSWHNLCLPVLEARRILGKRFAAPWVYSSYGSDLHYFPHLSEEHRAGVEAALGACDYYIAECQRDVRLAGEFGFAGEPLGVVPAFGGTDTAQLSSLRRPGPASGRKTIFLKGADQSDGAGDPIGRAMVAMRAFEMCEDILQGHRIVISKPSPSIRYEAAVLSARTNLDIQVLPYLPYEATLRILGASRVMVALTVTDGLPSTLVEAMALGAYPIHSDLESIAEWIVDGENGALVPAEDADSVAAALRAALEDDELIDSADILNARLVETHLTPRVVLPKVIEMYEHVADRGPLRSRA